VEKAVDARNALIDSACPYTQRTRERLQQIMRVGVVAEVR
jgi:hypothetical protein